MTTDAAPETIWAWTVEYPGTKFHGQNRWIPFEPKPMVYSLREGFFLGKKVYFEQKVSEYVRSDLVGDERISSETMTELQQALKDSIRLIQLLAPFAPEESKGLTTRVLATAEDTVARSTLQTTSDERTVDDC